MRGSESCTTLDCLIKEGLSEVVTFEQRLDWQEQLTLGRGTQPQPGKYDCVSRKSNRSYEEPTGTNSKWAYQVQRIQDKYTKLFVLLCGRNNQLEIEQTLLYTMLWKIWNMDKFDKRLQRSVH